MGFKGIYKHKSSVSKVGLLLLIMFLSVMLHTLFIIVLIVLFTDNGMALIQNQDLNNPISIHYLKALQLFSGIGLFIAPMLFFSYLTNFNLRFYNINRQNTILVIAIMLLITPFIALLLEWNMMIDFPEWLLQFDVNSEALVAAFLQMDNIWDLIYTLLVIAVVPAIGEELLFRGYLQKKITDWQTNPHIAILITAFLFSAIHFHLQGMIPRFVLGVLLGYFFYWSNSIWLPILAHFVNNMQAVIFSYPLFKTDSAIYSLSPKSSIDPCIALFSFISVVLLLYILYQNSSIKNNG